jgi:hypothetical protein
MDDPDLLKCLQQCWYSSPSKKQEYYRTHAYALQPSALSRVIRAL